MSYLGIRLWFFVWAVAMTNAFRALIVASAVGQASGFVALFSLQDSGGEIRARPPPSVLDRSATGRAGKDVGVPTRSMSSSETHP